MKESLKKGRMKLAAVIGVLLVLGTNFVPDVTAKEKQAPSDIEKYMKSLKGKVIAEGKKLDDGNCWVNYSIIGWGNSSFSYGRINITTMDDCKVIVSDVAIEKAEHKRKPAKDRDYEDKRLDTQSTLGKLISLQSAVAVEREGWAENVYQEQFHIDVTEISVDMDYWDDGNQVYNGHDAWIRPWWRSATGWYRISSGGTYYPYGPSEVWIKGYGEFQNSVFGLWHKLHAEFDGYPGGPYSYACSFEGTQPPLWHTHCSGGIRSPT